MFRKAHHAMHADCRASLRRGGPNTLEPVSYVNTVSARLADQRVVEAESALVRVALGQAVGKVLGIGDVLDPRPYRESRLGGALERHPGVTDAVAALGDALGVGCVEELLAVEIGIDQHPEIPGGQVREAPVDADA